MHYESANEIKSSFEDVYHAQTPHGYFKEMQRLGYEIGEQAKPYFRAAAELLHQQLGEDEPVRLMDLGCSYGVGATLMNCDVSFQDLADFFKEKAPQEYRDCVEGTRELVQTAAREPVARCNGADASKEAIQFASDADLIEAGIAKNLENGDRLGPRDATILKQCNLLTSTGAIGYVGPKTLNPFLDLLGKDLELSVGPYAVVTILRMFDPEPVLGAFSESGYPCVQVPGVRLRQREFDGQREYQETLALLRDRGVDPEGWEAEGHLYADLFAAAPRRDLPLLVRRLEHVHEELNPKGPAAACR